MNLQTAFWTIIIFVMLWEKVIHMKINKNWTYFTDCLEFNLLHVLLTKSMSYKTFNKVNAHIKLKTPIFHRVKFNTSQLNKRWSSVIYYIYFFRSENKNVYYSNFISIVHFISNCHGFKSLQHPKGSLDNSFIFNFTTWFIRA